MKTEEQIKYSTWSLIKDMSQYVKPYRWRFFVATFLRFSGDVANLYPAIALASIVTFFMKYSAGQPLDGFWLILGLWTGAVVFRNFTHYIAKFIAFNISEKTALDAQLKAINRLFVLDISWHEKENAGSKLKKIQRGGTGMDRIQRMWINNYIEIFVNFIGIIYILSITDKIIGIALAVFMAIYYVISFLSLRKIHTIIQGVNTREDDMHGLVYQAINNIRSVKISGINQKIVQMIGAQADDLFSWVKRRVLNFQVRGFTLNIWAITFRAGAMAFIAIGIMHGRNDVGFLVLFNTYFLRILESVSELSETTQDFIVNKYGIARMQSILEVPVAIEDEKKKKDFPKSWKKLILENVSFAYGKHQVLNNISFGINKGERIGIVGLSGAGKSTLFKLLLKENEDFSGSIRFDDLSVKDIRKDSYYKNVGVVLQDTEVFNFTLKENIMISSDKEMEDKELSDALRISHVDDYIGKLPLGVETFIGEKGVKLSGGEKQRLGIARAIYKKPEILFLDEATSHLDLESEEKIKDSLHEFFQKVTAVVIAHRLTTIKEMDRILVIENGEIVESGNFEELYGRKGRFFELWEKQKL